MSTRVVVELGPFELEEQQLGADHRAALFDLLHPRAPFGVGRVGREIEADEAPGAPDDVVHLGEAAHELDQSVGVERVDPPAKTGELVGRRVGAREQLVEAGISRRGEQRVEIPDDVVGSEIGRGHDGEAIAPATGTPPPARETSLRGDLVDLAENRAPLTVRAFVRPHGVELGR